MRADLSWAWDVWNASIYRKKEWNVARWTAAHVKPPSSAFGKRVLLDKTPWVIPIMEAYVDPKIHTLVVMASAQTGKTLSMISCFMWSLVEDPSSVIIGLNTEEMAKKFCRVIMNPHLNLCGPLNDILPMRAGNKNSRGGRLVDQIVFDKGNFVMVGPASDNFMRAWTARRLFGDEVAKWQKGGLANAAARTTMFPNKKIMLCSTPMMEGEGEEGDEFAQAWNSGTREVWGMKCLACGALVPSKFRDCLVWDKEAKRGEMDWDYKAVRESARLKCGKCGHEHENTSRNVADMNAGGGYVQMNRRPVEGVRSFRFNKLSAHPSISTWGNLAVRFLRAKGEMYMGNSQPYIDFFTLDLGEPFLLSDDIGDSSVHIIKGESESVGKRHLRTIGIDVQRSHWWAVCREWNQEGDSVLREAVRLESEVEILDFVSRWEVIGKCVGIDCAFARTPTLMFCGKNGFLGIQGHHSAGVNAVFKKYQWQKRRADGTVVQLSKPFSMTKVEALGRQGRKRGRYVEINSHELGVLVCRLRDRKMRSEVRWEVSEKAVDSIGISEYRRQLLAVRMMPMLTPQKKRYHGLVNASKDDHLFDCEKYALVMAMRQGVSLG